MVKLSVFNFISLDGYYKGQNEDISWHLHGQQEGEYSAQAMQSNNILLFGRVTYQMMASFWPTPMALERAPHEAAGLNRAQKIVFSNTLQSAGWNNSTIVKGNIISKVKELKRTAANDMTILGSGSIVTQLADAGLIDSFQYMIDPVVIGNGTSVFNGIKQKLNLELISSKVFKSGTVLLTYRPVS